MDRITKSMKHALAAVLAVATAGTMALSAAQEGATVKVGQEIKKTSGVVVRLENGDAACYMTLKDDRGAEFTESAAFEICSQKPPLAGRRVNLRYGLANVMAAACQGDPGCKKSDRIALIVEARVVGAADSKPGARATGPSKPAAQTSFCTPLETVVFACRVGAKLVSVCASTDAAPNRGYLQYRFGKPDSRDPLELSLPEAWVAPDKAATGETVMFSGGGGAWLRFGKSPFSYVVYTGIGRWGPGGATAEKQGIVVERAGKAIANLKCADAPTSELGPEWFDKTGVKNGGEEFLFPD